ncbi:MAG: hypothetical protein ACKVQU_33760 [Burkholderiales bacterium]
MTTRNSSSARPQVPASRAPAVLPRSPAPGKREPRVPAPGLLQPFVRTLIWPVFILTIANGFFLYCLPWLAEDWYAWAIRPSVNAGAMGAGYVVGALAAGMGLFAVRHWRSIRPFMPALFAIGLMMTIATVLHADRFRWGNPFTWLWIIVYVALPIVATLVWSLQVGDRATEPVTDKSIAMTAGTSVAIGAVIALTGIVWYLNPQSIIYNWPWPLTPLMTRTLASWYVFMGILLFASGTTLRHIREIPIVHATVAGWAMLLLLLVPFHWSSMKMSAVFVMWVVCHLLLLAYCAVCAFKAWERMRKAGDDF